MIYLIQRLSLSLSIFNSNQWYSFLSFLINFIFSYSVPILIFFYMVFIDTTLEIQISIFLRLLFRNEISPIYLKDVKFCLITYIICCLLHWSYLFKCEFLLFVIFAFKTYICVVAIYSIWFFTVLNLKIIDVVAKIGHVYLLILEFVKNVAEACCDNSLIWLN